MTHRFPIKEIALQTGLGTATIDRVLNDRPNVSPQTRRRVTAAIKELERQETQLATQGRRMFVDFVVEAPARFSREVKNAAEKVAPEISAAVCRPRFLLQEIMSEDEVVAALSRIEKRGSHGVCLKARDLPGIRDAVDRLIARKIPVVTFVTDIPTSKRIAYIGVDNANAGRTAAYLVSLVLGNQSGTVLTTTSQNSFLGEETRATAFRREIRRNSPQLRIVETSGGSGVLHGTTKAIEDAVEQLSDLKAVYSIGGGNRAVLNVLNAHRLKPKVFIGHDFDEENSELLKSREIHFLLNHDIDVDMRKIYGAFLRYGQQNLISQEQFFSTVQIQTPENIC